MKLTKNTQSAGILIGLLVIVLAVVIIGMVAYAIFKALANWKPRQLDPDDVAEWRQSAATEIETNMPANGILSDGTFVVQLVDNVSITPIVVRIQRSTNLVDWETVAMMNAPDAVYWSDPTPPWPQAFYRVRK